MSRVWHHVLLACLLTACGKPAEKRLDMLGADMLPHWHPAEISDNGATHIATNALTLDVGKPMTGVRFDAWESLRLPVTDYALEFDAQRVEGHDFFASITLPVRRIDTCATLVVGGWGGGLVGISSIDGQDASENATRGEHQFVNGRWYHLRLEVRDEEIKGWLEGHLVINASIKARTISLRPGDIEQCAPFGVATYFTKGMVRNLVIERLP